MQAPLDMYKDSHFSYRNNVHIGTERFVLRLAKYGEPWNGAQRTVRVQVSGATREFQKSGLTSVESCDSVPS